MNQVVAAITGIGVVAPCGIGKENFWEGLLADPPEGQRKIADWDPSPWFKNRKEARRADRFTQFALASAEMAMEETPGFSDHDPTRVGVLVGTGIGGISTLEEQIIVRHERGVRRVSPFLVPMMMSNAASANISLRFGFQGPCEAITTACAAGTHSIGRALDWIRSGRCDAVVTGGSEAAITTTAVAGFSNMTALSSSGVSMPFNKDRDGFVIGEGSAVILLERLDLAEKRGANILGIVAGSASTADAHHITAPSPTGEGAVRCIELALADAGLSASDIVHINAHGTSTPLNEAAEAEATAKIFGSPGPPITSIKGVTGHSFGAAGALEAAAVALSMVKKTLPPTVGTKEIDPALPQLDLVTEPRAWEPGPTISNSFGFGGHNGTIVLKPHEK